MPRSDGWIAIETSGSHASVALGTADGEVLEEVMTGHRPHAREVVPALAGLMNRAGHSPKDVQGIVISDGPGSFTGLRIGATVAKALAHVHHCPLRTASALSVIARGAWRASAVGTSAGCDQRILAVTDALRGESYAALYRIGSRELSIVLPPAVVTPAELATWPAADMRADTLPLASTLLDLLEVEGGTVPVHDLESWEPEYGRPAEAQARWEAAHGRPLPGSRR
ncbi:MAG TPA: tRNA (adenosine(37)-N6)-threonylcarbamoyltransferase complex dimerization subunit type 1 TsaB [Gemmatimonadales bacterium]|nr:tRNA (adenosine(37)-N6)-threonylcarbamoyltransferase complex dimerization subunit type 1 TsaB [Gemmatimonadales bacterium]